MIKIPYIVTADISKYDGEAFNKYPDQFYLDQKKRYINKYGSKLGHSQLHAMPIVEELSRYCGLKKTNNIAEVAKQLEEDIAIFYNGRLVSSYFCFPSGFDLVKSTGKTFMEIHSPVPEREKLDRAADRVSQMIAKPGAKFRRFVWTLTTSSDLSRHPMVKSLEPPVTTLDNLFFRKETQTTVGYGDGRTTFFFVKVEVIPYSMLSKESKNEIVKSVNSMSQAILEYKDLIEIKKLLND